MKACKVLIINSLKMVSMFRIKDTSGFTLVEVAIVVIIIAIMAAIGGPVISSIMPDIHLKDEARTLYRSMQDARMLAVKNNRNTAILFDTAGDKYDICDDWNSTTVACDGAIIRTVQFITLLTDPAYKSGVGYGHGTSLTQANAAADAWPLAPDDDVSYSAPDNTVVFNPQGMGNAGFVYLDHKDNTTAYAVGSASSGIIRLMKWTAGSWQ